MPSRHPLARTLELFAVVAILVLAVVSALLMAQRDVSQRGQGIAQRLAITVRASANLVELTPSRTAADSLAPSLAAAVHAIALEAGPAIGLTVRAENGRVVFRVGDGEPPNVTAAGVVPVLGEIRTGEVGGRHYALAQAGPREWTVLAYAPRATLRLDAHLLRDIGVFALVGLILFYSGWRLLDQRLINPLSAAEDVTVRVAGGELSIEDVAIGRVGGGPLTEALQSMVISLRELVGAIRTSADESAALAEEISAATQQMTSSTQEVAATTSELTDRASRQSATVRSVAEDAERILGIAQELAAGALQAAHRNTALADLARHHHGQLQDEADALDRLAEEAAEGAQEATALAAAAEEIEAFVSRTAAVARQTHILALNAALEAARAGEEGQGFAVVADEVRRLATRAGRAATETRDTVQSVVQRLSDARERLLRLSEGGLAARSATQRAAAGMSSLAEQAQANDQWTQGISGSAEEVRGLIGGIAQRTTDLSAGTEDFAAAAQQIAAASEQLNAGTEEVAASATRLADAAQRLTDVVRVFRL